MFSEGRNLEELAGQDAYTAQARYHLTIIQVISIKKICGSHGVSLSSPACFADRKKNVFLDTGFFPFIEENEGGIDLA